MPRQCRVVRGQGRMMCSEIRVVRRQGRVMRRQCRMVRRQCRMVRGRCGLSEISGSGRRFDGTRRLFRARKIGIDQPQHSARECVENHKEKVR